MQVTKQLALGVGTVALSLALIGGVAAAALTPADAQAQHEKGKPPVAKIEEILGKLVFEGKLTVEQKDAIIARLKLAAQKVEEKRPAHEAKRDEKRDEKKSEAKRNEKKDQQRKEVHRLLGSAHRLAGEHLGLSQKALGEQLRSGKSLAEVAGTDSKPETTRGSLITAITAPAAARLAELKASGKLTEAQAVAAAAQLRSAAEKIVDARRDVRKGATPAKPKQP